MNRLRNTGIYYTLFGVLLAISFVLTNLWPISILGIILLIIYLVLKFVFKKKSIKSNLTEDQLQIWGVFLGFLPFIYVVLTVWYVWRPYKQTIILPENYEGVVVVKYNKDEGQKKEYTGGFLGIGASRLIKVDTTGLVKTQFEFHNNSIPLLGFRQLHYDRGGLEVYYENDLSNPIDFGKFNGITMDKYLVNKSELENLPNIYYTDFNYYPLMIFVVTKPNKYCNYFMTRNDIEVWFMQEKEKYPDTYIGKPRHKLNRNCNLKEFYY